MIEETARVVACKGEFAWVEAARNTACGQCSANKACGTAVLSKVTGRKITRMRAINTIHARKGDTVTIGLQESALLKGSFAVYILPLLLMLFFAIAGKVIALQTDWPVETTVIVFAVAGMITAAVWLRRFTRRIQNDRRYQPVILRRVATGLD